jgi:hypothetical protein
MHMASVLGSVPDRVLTTDLLSHVITCEHRFPQLSVIIVTQSSDT